MIERIRGRVVCAQPRCVVDVGGVGFDLIIPEKDRDRISPAEPEMVFYTVLYVREDRMNLYGFLEVADRELFLRLIEVSGVGPRLALGALSVHSAARIVLAIQRGDRAFLTTLSGVGRRTADRLCVELSDKLGDLSVAAPADATAAGAVVGGAAGGVRDEVVLALTSLGMSRASAEHVFDRIDADTQSQRSVEELVREALLYAGNR